MKKEYFTIPNLLGYLRIMLLPVFLYFYYHAETLEEYLVAFLILAVAMLTDVFDGMIARKFNQVTDFGKALDPIADKLTQGVLAIAVSFHYPLIFLFIVLFVVKEVYMGIMGLYIINKKKIWIAAQWFGKVSTVILDAGIFALLVFPNLNITVANIMIFFMMFILIFSLVNYIFYHRKVLKEKMA